MKNTFLIIVLSVFTITVNAQKIKDMEINETGTYTDKRDGKQYKTIKIGNQTWMAENLAFKANEGCWAYDNDTENVDKYGYLYNYETAKNVCPSTDGWRLPTKEDFEILLKIVGDNHSERYKALVQNGSSGFEVINAGWREINGSYKYLNNYSALLSKTGENNNVNILYFDGMNSYPFDLSINMGYSVRCIKNI